MTSQRAFDWEPPRRRAHLQRGSIEPLKAQQLPGAVGGAPRGTKNERPLGNSRHVPSPQAGKEKCSSSETQCLKGILSQPRRAHVHDKGAPGAGCGASSPGRAVVRSSVAGPPRGGARPGARPRPGLSGCFACSHTAGISCPEAEVLGLRPSLRKWRRRRSAVSERPPCPASAPAPAPERIGSSVTIPAFGQTGTSCSVTTK